MERLQIEPDTGFHGLAGTPLSQAATMVLEPDSSTGGPDNRHEHSDQWLYVLSGRGTAKVENREVELDAGVLLLIESGEVHEIVNTGEEPLRTLNFYAPPEY
jgi:mannose-6-phosphate isomerase-like protein (cupin superfamily)